MRHVVDLCRAAPQPNVKTHACRERTSTFCIYDGPSPEAIRQAAETTGLPVDRITEVSVLDPYPYH